MRWMADPKIAGCGGFGDLGTHSLDLLMWLIGDVEAVTADIKVVTGRYGPCDECGEALIRFKSGVTGTLAAGWVDVANPLTLEISGTEGHAAIFEGKLYFKAGKVAGADGQKPWTKLPPALPPPLEMFIAAVAGKPDARPGHSPRGGRAGQRDGGHVPFLHQPPLGTAGVGASRNRRVACQLPPPRRGPAWKAQGSVLGLYSAVCSGLSAKNLASAKTGRRVVEAASRRFFNAARRRIYGFRDRF